MIEFIRQAIREALEVAGPISNFDWVVFYWLIILTWMVIATAPSGKQDK